jgi:hypothetical protein
LEENGGGAGKKVEKERRRETPEAPKENKKVAKIKDLQG